LTKTEIEADKKNIFSIAAGEVSYTHVRLNIFPDGGISRVRVFGVRVPEPIVETVVAEEIVVDELKVVETVKEGEEAVTVAVEKDEVVAVKETITTTTTTAAKKGSKKAATATVQLTSDVSSVETLVGDETITIADIKDESTSKKTAAKRGRPSAKGAAAAAVAATKLAAGGKKKAKGRSASVLDEDDEASTEVAVSSSPRSKKARE